ncbi:MAG: hypothetical protein DCC55_30790 [Chloroflexi bacterium]|nr:MAG: hypothetical protein DCC55_30790 [Chloroflexota bacterium]
MATKIVPQADSPAKRNRISVADIMLGTPPEHTLSDEDIEAIRFLMRKLRSLEDELLTSGITRAQRLLVGHIRHHRMCLRDVLNLPSPPEDDPATSAIKPTVVDLIIAQ